MLLSDICDKLLYKYSLTNSCTTEKTDFSTFLIWAEKVNDFDSCLKDFCLC